MQPKIQGKNYAARQDEIKKAIEFFRELAMEIDMNDDYFALAEEALQEKADHDKGGV